MQPPILIVDDTPEALPPLAEALDRRYSADYRISAHTSAAAAIDELRRSQRGGEPVALVIADQWMPEMDGTDAVARDRHGFVLTVGISPWARAP